MVSEIRSDHCWQIPARTSWWWVQFSHFFPSFYLPCSIFLACSLSLSRVPSSSFPSPSLPLPPSLGLHSSESSCCISLSWLERTEVNDCVTKSNILNVIRRDFFAGELVIFAKFSLDNVDKKFPIFPYVFYSTIWCKNTNSTAPLHILNILN